MMTLRRTAGLVLLCWFVVATAACSRSPRVNFYALAPDDKTGIVTPSVEQYGIAVGPITLPDLVDRSQLVIRVEKNQVEILETHRWAEPLKSQIPRLLADNLGRLLGSDRVSAYGQRFGSEAGYQVLVDFRSFEATNDGVSVDAFWTVRRTAGGVAKNGRSLVREPAGNGSYDATVTAYSKALSSVSNDIAAAIRSETLPR